MNPTATKHLRAQLERTNINIEGLKSMIAGFVQDLVQAQMRLDNAEAEKRELVDTLFPLCSVGLVGGDVNMGNVKSATAAWATDGCAGQAATPGLSTAARGIGEPGAKY